MIRYRFAASIDEFSNEDIESINTLLNQLSRTARTLVRADLLVVTNRNRLLLAIHEDVDPNREPREVVIRKIVGMATLVPVEIPTGRSGHIEDVVVDEQFRGKGIGRELVKLLIEEGMTMGLRHIELTSNPSRVAANQMYRSLGFEQRNTNVYRFNRKPSATAGADPLYLQEVAQRRREHQAQWEHPWNPDPSPKEGEEAARAFQESLDEPVMPQE